MERGTSAEQDARFSDKMKKLSKTMKFPKNFKKKVNLKKVTVSVFRPWVTRRISELLGVDDDIVIEFALGILEQETLDPKMAQIHLTGFLEKNAAVFVEELWDLLLSAQENPNGIPTKFIEEKKEELRKKKIEEEKIARRIERERKIESEARELARSKRNQNTTESKKDVPQKDSTHKADSPRASGARRSRSPPRHRSSRDDTSRRERSSRDRSREYSSHRDSHTSDRDRHHSHSRHRESRSHRSSEHRHSSRRDHSKESSGSDSRSRARRHERESHRDRRVETESRDESTIAFKSRHEERRTQSYSRYNREEKVYSSDESPARGQKPQEGSKDKE